MVLVLVVLGVLTPLCEMIPWSEKILTLTHANRAEGDEVAQERSVICDDAQPLPL